MTTPLKDLKVARDNENFSRWFSATDLLLDSLSELFEQNIGAWGEAKPEERLRLLEGMMHQAVAEFFRPAHGIVKQPLTPDESALWQTIVNKKDQNPKKYY